MTEIARFAENSLFASSEPFFVETQTSQKGRKKETKWKNRGGNFGGLELNRILSEFIRNNQNQSEPI